MQHPDIDSVCTYPADMTELIPKYDHIGTQCFHSFCNSRQTVFDSLCHLIHLRFQLPQKGIVRLDLTVQLTAIRDDPLFSPVLLRLHLHEWWAIPQALVLHGCDDRYVLPVRHVPNKDWLHLPMRLTPKEELLFAVPTLRVWILSAVFGAFVVLGHPFIALRLFKLGGSEALFLAVLDTEIFFLGLVLPFSLFIQLMHRQQDVAWRL